MNSIYQTFRPYLIEGFCKSFTTDCNTILDGYHEVPKMKQRLNSKPELAKDEKKLLQTKCDMTNIKMAIAGGRISFGVGLVLTGTVVTLYSLKNIVHPIKFLDAPILPLTLLAMGIVIYLAQNDLIRICNQGEEHIGEIPDYEQAGQLPDNAGWLQTLSYGFNIFKEATKTIPGNIKAQSHINESKKNKYHVIRDTFLFPVWRLFVDIIHEKIEAMNKEDAKNK